jgi:integrase
MDTWTLPLSDKLLGMLNGLPKKNQRVFGAINSVTAHTCFHNTRKKAALKLQNPRLLQITFHTLRHWKGTMEYHKTHDPYHVKKLLGHKSIRSTEVYINIENALFNERNDEFHFAAAKTIEEAGKLITVGFEYVCHHEGAMLFRRRK